MFSMNRPQFLPAVLTDSPAFAQSHIDTIASWQPRAAAIHVDIIDGEFADNLTLDTADLELLNWHDFPIDLHLMTVEPIQFLFGLEDSLPLKNIRQVIGHVERMSSQLEFIQEVRAHGWQASLALDLYTPAEAIDAEVLPHLDSVYIMGGRAGQQGQQFHELAITTVKELLARRAETNAAFEIGVDIGMNATTIPLAIAAGATQVAIGSYLNGDGGSENWAQLHT